MKRLISFTIALGIICGCTACGEKPTENSGNSTQLAENQKLMLNAADIRMGDNFKSIRCLSRDPLSDSILTFGELKSGGYAGFVSNNSFGDYTQFRFALQENESLHNAVLLTGGRKAVLTILDGETMIYVYDRDGNIQKNLNCGEILTSDRFGRIYGCDDGFVINDDNSILTIISLDGETLGTIDLSSYIVHGISLDSEGIPTVVYTDGDTTYTAQIKGTELENKQECSALTDTAYTMTAGFGEYRLAAMFNGMLYGLKDNSWVKLCDFIDNDFNGITIYSLAMTGEKEFAVAMSGVQGDVMKLLTEADISALESKTVIRVANLAAGDMTNEPARIYNSAKPDSPCIEGAWDFIKTVYFSEEYYTSNNTLNGTWLYPAVEEYYIKQLEEQKNATYIDENGETFRGDKLWIEPDMDDVVTYYEFTDEECEKYDKIVREAVKDVRQGDSVIYDIILEETMPFFEGECTAEKTAQNIQNRVSIYLSERYG